MVQGVLEFVKPPSSVHCASRVEQPCSRGAHSDGDELSSRVPVGPTVMGRRRGAESSVKGRLVLSSSQLLLSVNDVAWGGRKGQQEKDWKSQLLRGIVHVLNFGNELTGFLNSVEVKAHPYRPVHAP